MEPSHAFHRILLDLDLAGGPVGLSVETWVDDRRIGLTVMPKPGPFDTPLDSLAVAVRWCDVHHGDHLPLPF